MLAKQKEMKKKTFPLTRANERQLLDRYVPGKKYMGENFEEKGKNTDWKWEGQDLVKDKLIRKRTWLWEKTEKIRGERYKIEGFFNRTREKREFFFPISTFRAPVRV